MVKVPPVPDFIWSVTAPATAPESLGMVSEKLSVFSITKMRPFQPLRIRSMEYAAVGPDTRMYVLNPGSNRFTPFASVVFVSVRLTARSKRFVPVFQTFVCLESRNSPAMLTCSDEVPRRI